jgi:DNA-binding LacI/PurR family transcriptional regulator
VGHNDTSTARNADPALSTIRQNFAYIGSSMMKSAMALAHGATEQSGNSPKPHLIVRGSCGGHDVAGQFQIPNLDIEVELEAVAVTA